MIYDARTKKACLLCIYLLCFQNTAAELGIGNENEICMQSGEWTDSTITEQKSFLEKKGKRRSLTIAFYFDQPATTPSPERELS